MKYCTEGGNRHDFDESGTCFACGEPATAAQLAKAAGLPGLTHVANATGQSLQTLTNWHHNKPELFRIVIAGCVAELKNI